MKEYNNSLKFMDYKMSLKETDRNYAEASYTICDTLNTAHEALVGFNIIQEYDENTSEAIQIANGKLIVEVTKMIVDHMKFLEKKDNE